MCNKMEWHKEKLLNAWRKGGTKRHGKPRHQLKSAESNPAPCQWKLILAGSVPTPTVPGWWRWNEGGHFSKTMITNTAKETLNWFQRKKIKLLEWPSQSWIQ